MCTGGRRRANELQNLERVDERLDQVRRCCRGHLAPNAYI
jgi:hypothetical protein